MSAVVRIPRDDNGTGNGSGNGSGNGNNGNGTRFQEPVFDYRRQGD
jgi:hypothetical protein